MDILSGKISLTTVLPAPMVGLYRREILALLSITHMIRMISWTRTLLISWISPLLRINKTEIRLLIQLFRYGPVCSGSVTTLKAVIRMLYPAFLWILIIGPLFRTLQPRCGGNKARVVPGVTTTWLIMYFTTVVLTVE